MIRDMVYVPPTPAYIRNNHYTLFYPSHKHIQLWEFQFSPSIMGAGGHTQVVRLVQWLFLGDLLMSESCYIAPWLAWSPLHRPLGHTWTSVLRRD